MRTITAAQDQMLRQRERAVYARVKVDPGSGFIDLSDLEGRNWVTNVEYTEAVDSNGKTAAVQFQREVYDLSLATLVDDSKLNQPAVILDVGHGITIETAVIPMDALPEDSDFEIVFEGEIVRMIGLPEGKTPGSDDRVAISVKRVAGARYQQFRTPVSAYVPIPW